MTQQQAASPDKRIDLVHAQDFDLGPAHVRPSILEIRAGDTVEVVERRVMQLLVALVQARGMPVSRDELIECCWGGLIVSDDAVNQCVSKLRRALAAVPGVSVTSVPRVGYRLVDETRSTDLKYIPAAAPPGPALARRAASLVAILAVASVLAFDSQSEAGASGDSALAHHSGARGQRVDLLHDTAVRMFRERTRPGYAEAEKLLRQAIALDPENAPSWARLSMVTYAPWWWAEEADPGARVRLRSEAISYARRSLALDPNLAEGHQAMGFVLWDKEGLRYLERAAILSPNDAEIRQQLADLLERQLELARALSEAERGLEFEPTSSRGMQTTVALLGRMGRHSEAYALVDRFERMTHRAADARRARFMLDVSQGKLADAAARCSRSLDLGDEDSWWPRACLVEIATALHDRDLVARMLRLQPKLAAIIASESPDHSIRLARTRPNEWWSDVFVGSLARQLVATSNDRLLLSLFDDRYESVEQFWEEQSDRADMVAPSLILAMRRSGRRDEAGEVRSRWLRDIRKMQAEGDTYFRVPVWSAQLEALDGHPQLAARWLDEAVKAGWKGYGHQVLAFEPDRDPIFALVGDAPEMRRAIARFRASAGAEEDKLRRLRLQDRPWAKAAA